VVSDDGWTVDRGTTPAFEAYAGCRRLSPTYLPTGVTAMRADGTRATAAAMCEWMDFHSPLIPKQDGTPLPRVPGTTTPGGTEWVCYAPMGADLGWPVPHGGAVLRAGSWLVRCGGRWSVWNDTTIIDLIGGPSRDALLVQLGVTL